MCSLYFAIWYKWEKIACNKEPINKEVARLAINNAYQFLEFNQPNIIFFSTPKDALEFIDREIADSWGKLENSSLKNPIARQFTQQLIGNFNSQIKGDIYEQLKGNLDNGLTDRITQKIANQFSYTLFFSIIWAHASSLMSSSPENSTTDNVTKAFIELLLDTGFILNRYVSLPLWEIQKQISQFWGNSAEQNNFTEMYEILFTGKFSQKKDDNKYQLPQIELSSNTINILIPSVLADYAYYIDYLHQVLNCDRDETKWNIFQDLITSCGWIFPYEKTVLVCDRKI
ncbi:MAG: hypothetical protein ACFCAD_18015 [Pleurocapsa sp.]